MTGGMGSSMKGGGDSSTQKVIDSPVEVSAPDRRGVDFIGEKKAFNSLIFHVPDFRKVLYYEDFSPSSISKSVLSILESIKWQSYGLKLKEILIDREGNAVLQWEDLHLAHFDIAIHSYSIKTFPTTHGTSKRKLIRKAVEVALDNLKAQSPVLFLSSHARKIQKYAPDLSRTIARLIASSDDRVFQRECASLLGLEAKDAGNDLLELRIEEKLVEVISMNDVKKDRDLAPSLFEHGPFRDEYCPEEDMGNEYVRT